MHACGVGTAKFCGELSPRSLRVVPSASTAHPAGMPLLLLLPLLVLALITLGANAVAIGMGRIDVEATRRSRRCAGRACGQRTGHLGLWLTWRRMFAHGAPPAAAWLQEDGWVWIGGLLLGYYLAFTWGLRARLPRPLRN